MFEIKFKKAGVLKEFSKDYVNVEDNLLALEHQVIVWKQGRFAKSC